MDMKKAKEYVQLGVIMGFRSYRAPMEKGWHLAVDVRINGGISGELIETSLGVPKLYSSLDTLYGQVEKIAGEVKEIAFSVR